MDILNQLQLEDKENIFINDFNLNIKSLEKGVIFLYCSWGPTSHILRYFVSQLNQKVPLYIFDIDEEKFVEFKKENKIITHGFGETFWVKNGVIIGSILKHTAETKKEVDILNSVLLS